MKTNRMKVVVLGAIGMMALLGLLLLAAPAINAELAVTNVVYSWDYAVSKYQNSMVVIYADGQWSPFLHQVIGPGTSNNEFNTTPVVTSVVAYDPPNYTATSTHVISTTYGGLMDYTVYMTDTDNIGQGFRASRRWSLVFCDRAKKQGSDPTPPGGDLDGNDLGLAPPTEYYTSSTFFIEGLPAVSINQQEACAVGNCAYQLTTRLVVNLDKDGNGQIDPAYLVGGAQAAICFYAEAQRPAVNNWGGNLQARISAGGGDKTVNFKVQTGPTAVTLSSFTAGVLSGMAIPEGVAIPGLALGSLGVIAAVSVWGFRRKRT